MNNPQFSRQTCVAAALFLCAAMARAEDPQPTTGAAARPPDKGAYTLFDPTPPDQMRGMDMDRPDKTNTPHTIDAGHLQIETGLSDYVYDRNRYKGANSRTDSVTLGQFDFRLGLLNNLEVNAVVDSFSFYSTTDYAADRSVRQSGLGDTVFGAKLNLWGNDSGDQAGTTALAIQPQFKVPSAREDIGNGHPELFILFPFSVNVAPDFQLNFQTTPSWERNTDNSGYVLGWANTAELDHSFSEKFDMYLEYWAHVSTEHHQEVQQTVDVGAKYALTENLVLDTAVDFGLNKASPTIEWVTGLSVRF